MHHTLFTNSLIMATKNTLINYIVHKGMAKPDRRNLTAKDRRRREECHSHGRRIQAASLISMGLLIALQVQTSDQAHHATPGSY